MRAQIAGPLMLIAVGAAFLVNNLVVDLPFGYMIRRGWPFILIAIGVMQLISLPLRSASGRHANVVGPVVLITIGTLFALQTIWYISFRDTWPLIPIAVGLALLAQNTLSPFAGLRRFGGRS